MYCRSAVCAGVFFTLVLLSGLDAEEQGSMAQYAFSGKVNYCISGIPLVGVEMHLKGFESDTVLTDENGSYVFESLVEGEEYCIVPRKEGIPENVITSYDAALIYRHVVCGEYCGFELGSERCDTLAADVTGNEWITSLDAFKIMQYVVGLESFSDIGIGTWKFVPDSLCFIGADMNLIDQDYQAFICGEVSGNLTGAIDTTVAPEVAIILPDTTGIAGEEIEIPVLVDLFELTCLKFLEIYSMDMILAFDPSVLIVDEIAIDQSVHYSLGEYRIDAQRGYVYISIAEWEPIDLCSMNPAPLLWMQCQVNPDAAAGDVGTLSVKKLLFNEGLPQGYTENGSFTVEPMTISGKVEYCNGFPYVPRTQMWLSGDTTAMVLTNDIGLYSFDNVRFGGEYCVRPSKEGDVGDFTVTALDATQVGRFIIRAIQFDACDSLAADVNDDGRVNVLDIVLIGNYVIRAGPSGHVGEWKFVPEQRCFDTLSSRYEGQGFEAIIVGDVTQNWEEPSPPKGVRGAIIQRQREEKK